MLEYRLLQSKRKLENQKLKTFVNKPRRRSKSERLQLEFNYLEARPWEELSLEEQKRYFILHKRYYKE